MEQRQHGDDDVIGLHAEQAAGDVGVHVELHVGQLGALGAAGRARGVDNHRRVGQLPLGEPYPVRHGEQLLERVRARGVRGVAHRVDLAQPGRLGALGRVAEHAFPGDQDLAPQSRSWKATSGALSSTFSGTTTPPALRIPK